MRPRGSKSGWSAGVGGGLLALGLSVVSAAEPGLPAFPGAEGHGAFTRGGRGGKVVRVTNLNRRGPGSFSWALNEVKEPRTIVFTVSGVIDCRDEISFIVNSENDQVTIAGETSPGGVAIYNYRRFEIKDGAEEVILRFLRFRGTRIHTKNDPDGLLIWKARNVIVDHCSFAGACDETISTSDAENVTIQWTGYDESRKAEAHADYFENDGQWHNYGGLSSRSKKITIHHCLFAHHSKRNPLVGPGAEVEAVNNVVYNYSNSQQTWGAAGEGLTIVNCVFKLGPDRRKRPIPVRDNARGIRGCVSLERDSSPGPAVPDRGRLVGLSLENVNDAESAYQIVLERAGALPRDATSARMAREARTGTGRQGYVGDIEADRTALQGKAAPKDSDKDGLPDEWEARYGGKADDPRDSTQPFRGGYTRLELYCHDQALRLIKEAGVARR